jgi:hypothetical protein
MFERKNQRKRVEPKKKDEYIKTVKISLNEKQTLLKTMTKNEKKMMRKNNRITMK